MSHTPQREPATVEALGSSSTAAEACAAATTYLHRSGHKLVSAYLVQGGLLRCRAVRGYGQLYDGIPPGTGVIGRALASEQVVHVRSTPSSEHYRPAAEGVEDELAVPLLREGVCLGVLNVESSRPMGDAVVRSVVQTAEHLTDRLLALGGPPAESRSQRLVRLATTLSEASDLDQLSAELLQGACSLSGLSSSMLVSSREPVILAAHGPLSEALRSLSARELAHLLPWVSGGTSSRSSGERGAQTSAAQQALSRVDVRSFALVPLVSREQLLAVLVVADSRRHDVDAAVVETLELLAALGAADLRTLQATRSLEQQARSDPLTGLPHRGAFDEALRTSLLLGSSFTAGCPAVIVLDLDGFKQVNDQRGHAAGDQVLQRTARVLASALRAQDVLHRVGGDEFAVLLDVHDERELENVLDRLVWAARRSGHTISAGATTARPLDDAASLLARADGALYRAKAGGRDRACLDA